MQIFVVVIFVIAATWTAVVGGRAVSAARFNRALRAYADPISIGTEALPQKEEPRARERNRYRDHGDPWSRPHSQVPEQRVS
ncbi:MAG: hypothetical protein QOE62_3896 [Actinomycetota bacterium]|nr:hypothetical protein [Actinomycetota bacterium]